MTFLQKTTVALAAVATIGVGTARADLVLTNLQLASGQGFGAVETIFTLQAHGNNSTEQGCYAYGNTTGAYDGTDNNFAGTTANVGNLCNEGSTNDVASGAPKNALPSFGDVAITNVNQIGLVLNLNQISNQGITLNSMDLSFYTSTGDVIFNAVLPSGWCSVAALCSGTNTFLSSIQGQGGNGYVFVLDAAQQAGLAAAIATAGASYSSILVGSGGNFGCAGTVGVDCKVANDGAESIQLANISSPIVTTPEPSTTALMATGLLALVGMVRRRRQS